MSYRIYVAGAYSDSHILGVARNIMKGRDLTAELMELGFFAYCPWNDWEIAVRKELPMEYWKKNGMAWLQVSEAVVLVPGWENSGGTKAEIAEAERLGIPVFTGPRMLQMGIDVGLVPHRYSVPANTVTELDAYGELVTWSHPFPKFGGAV